MHLTYQGCTVFELFAYLGSFNCVMPKVSRRSNDEHTEETVVLRYLNEGRERKINIIEGIFEASFTVVFLVCACVYLYIYICTCTYVIAVMLLVLLMKPNNMCEPVTKRNVFGFKPNLSASGRVQCILKLVCSKQGTFDYTIANAVFYDPVSCNQHAGQSKASWTKIFI